MEQFLTGKPNNDLRYRFPENKYTIIKVPYYYANPVLKKVKVPTKPQIKELRKLINAGELPRDLIHYVTVIFKKFTWSVKNDLLMASQVYDKRKLDWVIDSNKYHEKVMEKLFVAMIDEESGEELYSDEDIISKLDADVFEGIIYYFFEYPHFEVMTEREEIRLSRDIHKHYSYWNKKYSSNPQDRAMVKYQRPPICPSIVIIEDLAKTFPGWTLEYIRSLDEKDIKALQILQTQKEVADYERNHRKLPTELLVELSPQAALEALEKQGIDTMNAEDKRLQKLMNGLNQNKHLDQYSSSNKKKRKKTKDKEAQDNQQNTENTEPIKPKEPAPNQLSMAQQALMKNRTKKS